MKKIIVILGCLVYSASIFAVTYTSTSSGALNTTTNWSGNNAPISLSIGDIIDIANNTTITNTTLNATPQSLTIYVESGSTLNFNSNTSMSFGKQIGIEVLSGGILNFNNANPSFGKQSSITIETGGQLNFNTGAIFGSQSDVTINNLGVCNVNGDLTMTSSIITVNGTLQVVGNLLNTGGSTVDGTGSVLVTGSISGGSTLTLSAPSNVLNAAIWTGTTSSAWNTAGNWSNGTVPTTSTDIAIPMVTSGKHYPIFNGQTINANVTILAGAEIDVT